MCSFFRYSLAKLSISDLLINEVHFSFHFLNLVEGCSFSWEKKEKSTLSKEDLEKLPVDEHVGPISSHYAHEWLLKSGSTHHVSCFAFNKSRTTCCKCKSNSTAVDRWRYDLLLMRCLVPVHNC